jgi:hypothetical protein
MVGSEKIMPIRQIYAVYVNNVFFQIFTQYCIIANLLGRKAERSLLPLQAIKKSVEDGCLNAILKLFRKPKW